MKVSYVLDFNMDFAGESCNSMHPVGMCPTCRLDAYLASIMYILEPIIVAAIHHIRKTVSIQLIKSG